MFDALRESFHGVVSKIRFHDDEKALKKALEELKKSLLKADVHYKATKELLKVVELETRNAGIGKESFLSALKKGLLEILYTGGAQGFVFAPKPPTIVLMVGLQGSGKTTTTAKLAAFLKSKGKKVLLVACDLQRLAAIEQLRQLSAQIEVDLYFEEATKDPAKIAQNAIAKANQGLYDVLLVDTAGRLAIDEPLMEELKGLKKALAAHETFYVADSLSGQDGVKSAEQFHKEIGLSGVILSKFDGDSKGGIALSIAHQIGIPVRFIGSGEKIPDLDPFVPERIINRLMGAGDIESLAEKTSAIISEKEAKNITKKIKKGEFNFNDFLAQMDNMKKLGSMQSVMSLIPGMGGMANALKDVDLDNSREIKQIRAMVSSMTPKEREEPSILNGSRRKRIALGSGVDIADVNRMIKQFDGAAKMAKRFSGKRGMQDLMSMMNQSKMGRFR